MLLFGVGGCQSLPNAQQYETELAQEAALVAAEADALAVAMHGVSTLRLHGHVSDKTWTWAKAVSNAASNTLQAAGDAVRNRDVIEARRLRSLATRSLSLLQAAAGLDAGGAQGAPPNPFIPQPNPGNVPTAVPQTYRPAGPKELS